MAYFHGVRAREIPTSIISPAQTTAGLPVAFGTAPLHLATEPAEPNKPVICYSYEEAVRQFGYSREWDKYTLCEAIYSEFQLYGVAPIVLINVLDPEKAKTAVTDSNGHDVSNDKTVVIADAVILSSLKVKIAAAGEPLILNTDYTAAYNDNEQLVISVIPGGALDSATKLYCDYDKIDTAKVTEDDLIGGIDANNKNTGLELINEIYPRFSIVPGILAAPGWSEKPKVAAVMKAKASNINTVFKCTVLTDIDTEQVKTYIDANLWKNSNSYTGIDQVVCYPCVRMSDSIFHMSTHVMGIIGKMDAANGDIPYQSPSNLAMQATGICLKDGTEVVLSLDQANLLNSQGIYTALNFVGGWKGWGNYTGAYPGNTDIKDTFIAVRRMFNWLGQTFILTYWQKVDAPLNKRFVDTVIDSEQVRLNGLVAQEYLLGADIKFLESENPTTDLMNGIFRVHRSITPPVPAQVIETIDEYDVNNFNSLFN